MALPGVPALLTVAGLLPHTPAPYLITMAIGFVIGAYGHMARLRWAIVIGILLIFLATLIFPLAVVLTNNAPPPGPEAPISP